MAHCIVEIPRHRHRLATSLEFGDHAIGNTALKRERSRLIAPRPTKEPPRSLDCGLDIVAEINDSGNERGLRLGLALPAHRPVQQPRLAVFRDQPRNQRVERPLAGFETVDVCRIEREERPTVLWDNPGLAGDNAAAEIEVDRLDQRDGQPIAVDNRQIAGVAAGVLRLWLEPLRRNAWLDVRW